MDDFPRYVDMSNLNAIEDGYDWLSGVDGVRGLGAALPFAYTVPPPPPMCPWGYDAVRTMGGWGCAHEPRWQRAILGVGRSDSMSGGIFGAAGLGALGAERPIGVLGLGALPSVCAQANAAGYGPVVTTSQWDTAEQMSRSSDPETSGNGKGMMADMTATCQSVLRSAKAQKDYLKETVGCDLTRGPGAEALQEIVNDALQAEGITFVHDDKEKSSVVVDGVWGGESCAGWVAAFDSGLDRGTIDAMGLIEEFKVFDACGAGADLKVPTCAGPAKAAPPPACPTGFRFSIESGDCVAIEPPPSAPQRTSKASMWMIGGVAALVVGGAYMLSRKRK